MKTFKKIISLLFAVVMIFSVTACEGEYNYAVGGGTGGGNSGDDMPDAPVLDGDPTNDFTVTLRADGEPYSPRMKMYAYWSDGFSVHTAPIDENGVARIDGLDGDYKVTLSAVPNEYTYDPNTHIATNDARNIVLDLYTLNHLTGSGTGMYDCYHFSKTGVYSAVIESAEDEIWFQYAPDGSGTYTVESWVDTTADNINPYIEVYGGSSQFKYHIRTVNDGGAMGSYTINFVHTVQIAAENISSGGQVVYTFALKADSKNNKYPITVTFAVKRDGDFELGGTNNGSASKGLVVPQFDFSQYDVENHNYDDSYTMKYPEYLFEGTSDTYIFDEERFKLWEIEKGGDGFYHVYDKEKYPDTEGYGPILYANITSACRFIDKAFTDIEYGSNAMDGTATIINSALSINGKNYKHFIEGHTQLVKFGYYCVSSCPCHASSQENTDWACTPDCTKCDKECRRCPEELIGHEGYRAYANDDGMVAVTAELKEFLLGYCEKQIFFYDGRGTLEDGPINGVYYQAVGESGWLFACAYYEQN